MVGFMPSFLLQGTIMARRPTSQSTTLKNPPGTAAGLNESVGAPVPNSVVEEAPSPLLMEPAGASSALSHVGFIPTQKQREIKARLIAAMRDDPLVVPETIGASEAARITRCAEIRTWWKDEEFRNWIVDRNESFAKAELLFDTVLDEMARRLPTMEDKHLIAAGKLLAEVARKMPDKWARGQADGTTDKMIAKMDGDTLRRFIETTSKAVGMSLGPSENATKK